MAFDIVMKPSMKTITCETVEEVIQKISVLLITMPPECSVEIHNLQSFDSNVERIMAMNGYPFK